MPNFIFRSCYRRPEMLYLSLEYEKRARAKSPSDFPWVTVFAIDAGASQETYDLAASFNYPKIILARPSHCGVSRNSILGYQELIGQCDEFILPIEEDILLHHNFFLFLYQNLNILRLPDLACFLTGETYRAVEEPNLGIFENSPSWYCPWGTVLTRAFVEHILSQKITFNSDGGHIRLDSGRWTGGDEYVVSLLRKAPSWRSFQTHINRFLNIGIYGYDFHPKNDSITKLTFAKKIAWLEEHLALGDWWRYSKTMCEIVGSDNIPVSLTRFNPLLDSENAI